MSARRTGPRSGAGNAKGSSEPADPSSGRAGAQDRNSEGRLAIGRSGLLVNGSDRLYRELVHKLLSFSALHEAIRDAIAAHVQLGGVQHTILQSIRHLGSTEPVAVRDVADHLRLSGAFITIETAKLQGQGLLEKRQSQTDRRKVSLILTKKAHALFERVAPLQQAVGDVQFGSLSAKQLEELVPLFTRLVETSREALVMLPHLTGEANRSKAKKVNAKKSKVKPRARGIHEH